MRAGNQRRLPLFVQAAGASGRTGAAPGADGASVSAEAGESDDDGAGGIDSGTDADGVDEGA